MSSPLGAVTLRMLADRRRSTAWWALGVTMMTALLASSYLSVRDTGDVFDDYVASLPESFREAFGLTGASITSPEGFLVSQLYSNLYPVTLLVLALGMAAWSIAGSEREGTLELVLANPVPRWRVAVERFVGLALVTALVTAVSTLAIALLGPSLGLGDGVPWWGVWSAGLQTFAFVLCLAALAFAVGAATGNKGAAIAAGSGAAILGFLVNALAPLADVVEGLRAFSPWYWLLRDNPVVTGPGWLSFGLPMLLSGTFVALGVLLLERRDLRG